MASTFQVNLEIKDKNDGQAVRYKPDGERFPQGQKDTLKMNVDCNYTFTVTFRPPRLLRYWLIRGEKMEFNRVKAKKDEDDVTVYEAQWSTTGVPVTKRGERGQMPIELEFEPGVTLKMCLQTKFYPTQETTHSRWGQEMHSLEIKGQVQDGQTFVDIQSEKLF